MQGPVLTKLLSGEEGNLNSCLSSVTCLNQRLKAGRQREKATKTFQIEDQSDVRNTSSTGA